MNYGECKKFFKQCSFCGQWFHVQEFPMDVPGGMDKEDYYFPLNRFKYLFLKFFYLDKSPMKEF